MTADMWLAAAVLLMAIVLFVTERLRVDVVALGVVVVLMLSGLLTTPEALSGFSNPAVLTIAALFVVGGAVMQTGLAGAIGRRILRLSGPSEARLTVAVMVSVAMLSAVMSDTGTVAVLLPAIISLSTDARISPSRLLIPLAYGSLLGGAMTLIGTPPNIIVSDLLREEGLEPFQFFSFTPIGVVLLLVGVVFVLFVGRRLLPDVQPEQELRSGPGPGELVELYRLPDNLWRLRVRRSSGLVGRTIADSRLRKEFRVTVLEIFRPRQPRALVTVGHQGFGLVPEGFDQLHPTADTVLELDDVLIVEGRSSDVWHAAASWDLGVQPAEAEDERALIDQEAGVAEVLLPPRSDLVGRTLAEAGFRSRYELSVLGIRRPDTDEAPELDSAVLRFGDILLVQGRWDKILALKARRHDFVVMGQPETAIGAPRRRMAPVALAVLLLMVASIVTNTLPVATASLLAALAMVLTGCLSMDQAYDAIDWKSVVLIAGMIPMSLALQQVGLVDMAARGLTQGLGDYGPLAVLAGLFLLTSGFTQVLSNTATTVLVAPIALAAARGLEASPYAFLMAVAIAASMAFASPVASPVNTLVMGAGRYRFGDYMRVGIPLILVTMLVTVLIVPLLWPLH